MDPDPGILYYLYFYSSHNNPIFTSFLVQTMIALLKSSASFFVLLPPTPFTFKPHF